MQNFSTIIAKYVGLSLETHTLHSEIFSGTTNISKEKFPFPEYFVLIANLL